MKKKQSSKKVLNDQVVLHISLLLNVILGIAIISWLVYMNTPSGRFETVTRGNDIMCGGQLTKDYPDADQSLINYICGNSGASEYLNDGYLQYKQSLEAN